MHLREALHFMSVIWTDAWKRNKPAGRQAMAGQQPKVVGFQVLQLLEFLSICRYIVCERVSDYCYYYYVQKHLSKMLLCALLYNLHFISRHFDTFAAYCIKWVRFKGWRAAHICRWIEV